MNLENTVSIDRRDVPRSLLLRSTVADLTRDAGRDWLLIILLWCLLAWLPLWLYPFWCLLVAGRFHALGVVSHDAIHLPREAGHSKLLQFMAAYPVATTFAALRYHHLRHHRDSGMATDPYFKEGVDERPGLRMLYVARGVLLFPFWSLRPYAGALALLFPSRRNFYGRVFLQDRSGEDLTRQGELIACAKSEWGQLFCQLPLWAGLASGNAFVIEGLLLPMWLTGLLASYRILCEHRYVATVDRSVNTVLDTTYDHHTATWHRLFLAPKNVGYHAMHHLHPQAGWRALPGLRAWYRGHLGEKLPPVREARKREPRVPWPAI